MFFATPILQIFLKSNPDLRYWVFTKPRIPLGLFSYFLNIVRILFSMFEIYVLIGENNNESFFLEKKVNRNKKKVVQRFSPS